MACWCFATRFVGLLSAAFGQVLLWLFSETFEPELCGPASFLEEEMREGDYRNPVIVEVGPRMAFASAWSSNAVSICEGCGVTCVKRLERSRRFVVDALSPLTDEELNKFAGTQCM